MGNFCIYCGKTLVNGRCDCAGFKAAEAASGADNAGQNQYNQNQFGQSQYGQNQYTSNQYGQNQYGQGANGAQGFSQNGGSGQYEGGFGQNAAPGNAGQNSAQAGSRGASANGAAKSSADAAALFKVPLELLKGGWKTPVTNSKSIKAEDKTSALLFIGLYAVLAFLLVLIHPPIGYAKTGISFGLRLLMALSMMLMICANAAAKAGLTVLFHPVENKYVDVLTELSVCKLYCLPGLVLIFVTGFFSRTLTIILAVFTLIVWAVSTCMVLSDRLAKEPDKKAIELMLIEAASAVLVFIGIRIMYAAIIGAYSLGAYYSIFR